MDIFDRNGNPIDTAQYTALHSDPEYKRIAYEEANGFTVSTVWLGLDHSFSEDDPPLIFETMVFPEFSYDEEACERYVTEREAMEGHINMVRRVKRGEFKKEET